MAKQPKANNDLKLDNEEQPKSGGGKKKLILLVLIGLLLLLGIGAAVYFFLLKDRDDSAASAPPAGSQQAAPILLPKPHFQALEPAFIVNLTEGRGADMLQLELVVMAHDEAVLEAIAKNDPRIRNNLLVLLSQQNFEGLNTRKGKEVLRKKILEEINRILARVNAPGAIQGVYFTDLKMQ